MTAPCRLFQWSADIPACSSKASGYSIYWRYEAVRVIMVIWIMRDIRAIRVISVIGVIRDIKIVGIIMLTRLLHYGYCSAASRLPIRFLKAYSSLF
jgi:hypothetical protein